MDQILLLQRPREGTDTLAGHGPSNTHTQTHTHTPIVSSSINTHSLAGEERGAGFASDGSNHFLKAVSG